MIDFITYLYRFCKPFILLVTLLIFYIIIYIDGVVAYNSSIYISNDAIKIQQERYTSIIFGTKKGSKGITDLTKDVTITKPIAITYVESIQQENGLYNANINSYTLSIKDLGIHESLFTFPMTFTIEDYEKENVKKTDPNLIDFEVLDIKDIRKGFMIGGHSSGYYTDNSILKDVFNSLDYFEIGDRLSLLNSNGEELHYKVIGRDVKELTEEVELSNRYYIYTCYPIGTTDKRLILELKEIIEHE